MEQLIDKFHRLKKERNAVVLAHYYQDPQIQDLADFMGDSLALAQAAKGIDADVILFCGVHFMAETAKILNPDKVVLVPDMNAGCSLADSCPPEEFKKWIDENPGHTVITYINASAGVKALSDLICTSSNALKIINSVPEGTPILFGPDKYLGRYIMQKTGREMKLWNGSCQVHIDFSEAEIINLMNKYPDAEVLAHPECPDNILDYADYVGSTTGIIDYAVKSDNKQFIILTEPGVIHEMQKKAPGKEYIPVPSLSGCACNNCPHMRLNTIEKMVDALENMSPELIMDAELRTAALKPLNRMLELS